MTKTRRSSRGRASKPRTMYWAAVDSFRKPVGPSWTPASAGFELRRSIKVLGLTWALCLKLHVVPLDDGTGKGGVGPRFMASVTLWPPELSRAQKAALTRSGWYAQIRRRLAALGYTGGWSESPWGRFGDFWKRDIPSLGRFAIEKTSMERLPVELWSPDAG